MNLIGVDVDSRFLVARISRHGVKQPIAQFANDAAGHRKLIAWATRRGASVRVAFEAAGVYSQAFALALHRTSGIEVMVVNPKAIHQFAQAPLQRGKTDAMDADTILEYLLRMAFKAWA